MPIFVKFEAELQSQFYLNWSLHYSFLANGPAAPRTNRQKWQKIKRRKEKKGMKRNCFRWKSIPTATMKTQEIINCQTVTFKMALHLLHSPYMTSINEMSNLKPLTLIRPELLNLWVRTHTDLLVNADEVVVHPVTFRSQWVCVDSNQGWLVKSYPRQKLHLHVYVTHTCSNVYQRCSSSSWLD